MGARCPPGAGSLLSMTPLSPADSGCITVKQYPRFVGAKKNTPIQFICYFEDPHSIQWYKLAEGSEDFFELSTSTPRYSIQTTENFTSFTISSITYEDNGIYVCDRKNLTAEQRPHDCGTQLKVLSEWELPILSAAQAMLLLLLSPFPPPWRAVGPAQGVSPPSWSLMAVCNALVSPRGRAGPRCPPHLLSLTLGGGAWSYPCAVAPRSQ